jgi:hypothetical protein
MSATHMSQLLEINWNGITIRIQWEPQWLNSGTYDVAHLDIESVNPVRAPLPITETGYLSHFTSSENVNSFGGPAKFILAWLEKAARSREWKKTQETSRQFILI